MSHDSHFAAGPSGVGPVAAHEPLPAPPRTVCGTVSGRLVDPLAPDWRAIDLHDIAFALSRLRRWAGQARRPISVGEHCLLAGSLAPPRFRLAADLHDGHEALLGDLIAPFEAAIVRSAPRARWAIGAIKHDMDIAIARRVLEEFAPADAAGLAEEAQTLAGEMVSFEVRSADELAGRTEDAVRLRGALQRLDAFGEAAARRVPAWAPDEDEIAARWLAEVEALTKARFAGK
jgi:hypothetical protein